MLLAGDEFGRTQKGNNNAYCQDTSPSSSSMSAGDRRVCVKGVRWTGSPGKARRDRQIGILLARYV